MSETSVRHDWCPVHGIGAKVKKTSGGVEWWECPKCTMLTTAAILDSYAPPSGETPDEIDRIGAQIRAAIMRNRADAGEGSAEPLDDFERVLALRHWTGSVDGPRHTCKCADCKAIKQVVHLARQAAASSQSKRAKELAQPDPTSRALEREARSRLLGPLDTVLDYVRATEYWQLAPHDQKERHAYFARSDLAEGLKALEELAAAAPCGECARLREALKKYAKHAPECRKGSRAGMHPQATFGADCSCGLDDILYAERAP